jgi:hypothetical protein
LAISSLAARLFLRTLRPAVRAMLSNSLLIFLPPVWRAALATRPTSLASAPISAARPLAPDFAGLAARRFMREALRLMVFAAALAPATALVLAVRAAFLATAATCFFATRVLDLAAAAATLTATRAAVLATLATVRAFALVLRDRAMVKPPDGQWNTGP